MQFTLGVAIQEAFGNKQSVYDAEAMNLPIAPDIRPYAFQKKDKTKKKHESNIAVRPDIITFPEGFAPPEDLFKEVVMPTGNTKYLLSSRD